MKKLAVTIAIAITTVMVMTLGLTAPVMAASPTHVVSGTALVPSGESLPFKVVTVHAISHSTTGEATGEIIAPHPGEGVNFYDVQYLAVNPDSSKAWIGFYDVQLGKEEIAEVQESPAELTDNFSLDDVNNYFGESWTLEEAVSAGPDLFDMNGTLYPFHKLVIK